MENRSCSSGTAGKPIDVHSSGQLGEIVHREIPRDRSPNRVVEKTGFGDLLGRHDPKRDGIAQDVESWGVKPDRDLADKRDKIGADASVLKDVITVDNILDLARKGRVEIRPVRGILQIRGENRRAVRCFPFQPPPVGLVSGGPRRPRGLPRDLSRGGLGVRLAQVGVVVHDRVRVKDHLAGVVVEDLLEVDRVRQRNDVAGNRRERDVLAKVFPGV